MHKVVTPEAALTESDQRISQLIINKDSYLLLSCLHQDAEDEEPIPDNLTLQKPTAGENFSKGILFYMQNNVIVGVLMWNVFGKMPIARRVSRTAPC